MKSSVLQSNFKRIIPTNLSNIDLSEVIESKNGRTFLIVMEPLNRLVEDTGCVDNRLYPLVGLKLDKLNISINFKEKEIRVSVKSILSKNEAEKELRDYLANVFRLVTAVMFFELRY
ncbi:hypothetical protein COX95_02900 [bacterium CG_4_10_14_0_2_um_filter_33_32]|nr:MAG: hypothetical protein AUJ93_02625 [bacterium CG2_30_33_46]PIR67976.1 MAG: hypothetical protein COU50_00440 [bacterium CG10_big_fil_rev_8_21_14_0_10_33_18]PIU77091.1 MAG: hypothetical protein COS74_00615 [bacterium CG06_land_8_20_14_3_00_33_50]PIW81188.1 MAG: hypothetical protein COZ97_03075 [bacterium CG_4_8_14_3_um_filter_33_28]PIY85043.1 MAG: hypothetical protein COY76_04235 [bacterium CG_4_10_14_0_8_um_filter_33_57]PIZ85792.1 MAG: hypothetical protein COX95_02900 [bacterium CG_4_10_1